ncbi:hypothetical protein C8Q73DRAFT_786188 [Cubamyces lactineus]|nr:hypothetical protein C8Q73DRAFT_786188 [Cubamyces lactineus]
MSGRARKPTEKGKLYAESRPGNQAKTAALKVAAPKISASATKATTKEPIREKNREPPLSHRTSREFTIQTLPSNRTSSKAQTLNLQAHCHAMPKTKLLGVASSRVVSGQRHSTPVTTPVLSRRLSQDAAKRLAEMRNPYTSPGIGQSRSNMAASSTRPSGRLHSPPASQPPTSQRRQLSTPMSQRQQLSMSPTSPALDEEVDKVLPVRVYQVSALSHRRNAGQLPTTRVDYRSRDTESQAQVVTTDC